MRYRLLGKTGLYVSELCLGCMTFGGGKGRWKSIGMLTAADAERLTAMAIDAGVNFIDTADVYAEGESERDLGSALASLAISRDKIILATKVRGRTGPGPNEIGLSRGHILSAVDASLKRLQTDYIDLYQIHGIDYDTPLEETLHALDTVIHAGKVRYVGFCNLPAWFAMKALAYADYHGLPRFISAQMYYSIAGRDIEREIVPLAREEGLAILPWSPLAGGLLSGKFDLRNPDPRMPAVPPSISRRLILRERKPYWTSCVLSPTGWGCRWRELRLRGCLRADLLSAQLLRRNQTLLPLVGWHAASAQTASPEGRP